MADTKGENSKEWENLEEVAAKMLVPGVSNKEVTDYYNQWAKSGYDQKIGEDFHPTQVVMGNEMKALFPANREKYTVLDVGAGTGLSGQHLRQIGFVTIDALEPAADMLRIAQEKNIYRHTFNHYITGQPSHIPSDTYDAAILVGVVGHGSVPCAAFEELARIVRPGGYIVNCMRAAYLKEIPEYLQNWQPMLDRLEKAGTWRVVKMDPYPNHFIGKEGLLTVFQVC